jgi:hypothetical protein
MLILMLIQCYGAGAEKPKLVASRSRNYELRLRSQLRLRLVSIHQKFYRKNLKIMVAEEAFCKLTTITQQGTSSC